VRNIPANHKPNANAWTSDIPNNITHIVFAQIGIQVKEIRNTTNFLKEIRESILLEHGPKHYEVSIYKDSEQHINHVILAYWDDLQSYHTWLKHPEVRNWWVGKLIKKNSPIGYWSEISTIQITHFETLYSREDQKTGVSHFIPIKPTNIHEYWGAMRDRIPVSATVDLKNDFKSKLSIKNDKDNFGKRIKVIVPEKVCLIRTGQDWSNCGPDEKKTYLDLVKPTLKKGSHYLDNHPKESGCISSNLLYEVDANNDFLEKSCVLAYFTSIVDLERWTHTHPTHKVIYETFYEMLKRYDYSTDLFLWHEVSVIEPEDLDLNYINCHPKTGFIPYFENIETDL
jgi:phenylacetaldoxime dehydratase/aldoxime dehydratase